LSADPATTDDLKEDRKDGDDEKNVNQSSRCVGSDHAENPQNDQHQGEGIEHDISPGDASHTANCSGQTSHACHAALSAGARPCGNAQIRKFADGSQRPAGDVTDKGLPNRIERVVQDWRSVAGRCEASWIASFGAASALAGGQCSSSHRLGETWWLSFTVCKFRTRNRCSTIGGGQVFTARRSARCLIDPAGALWCPPTGHAVGWHDGLLRFSTLHEGDTMNKNQVNGTVKSAAGKVQEESGKLVGSPEQQRKGIHKQVEGNLQKAVGNLEGALKDASRK
jgi:uncharacterized protein YjbJ (UPF0337 family)